MCWGNLLAVLALTGCGGPEFEEYYESVAHDFHSISSTLKWSDHYLGEPLESALACGDDLPEGPTTSAEAVFDRDLRNKLDLHDGSLVSKAYLAEMAGEVKEGRRQVRLNEWGSGYRIWCLPFWKWRLVEGADLYSWHDLGPQAYPLLDFPVVWEKREVYGDRVVVMSFSTPHRIVEEGIYDQVMQAARRWLKPEDEEDARVEERLGTEEPGELGRGILSLGARRDESSIDRIKPYIESDDERVKWAAVWALGAIGSEKGVTAVEAALEDSDERIERAVIKSLWQIGGERTENRLIELLRNSEFPEVRALAAWALGSGAYEGGKKALKAALSDEAELVRDRAESWLKRLERLED